MENEKLIKIDVSSDSTSNELSQAVYRVYRKRWFVLTVLTLLNFSNGMLWISFAPINDKAAIYYNVTASDINWLSVVYPVAALPFSLVSAWFIDTFGLRHGIILGAWLNGIGGGIRILSSLHVLSGSKKFAVVMVGQTFAAFAQTLLLPSPPKLAALWFGESERVIANMISSTANTVGILVANIAAPYIVKTEYDIPVMLVVFAAPAFVVMILATAGVTSSVPPTPPAASAAEDSVPFFKGLKEAMKSKSFLVLLLCFGTGIGMFSTLITLLEQIICVHRYSDVVVGNITALAIGVGFIGAGIASFYVDRTKKFEMVAKVCYSFAAISMVFFALISRYDNQGILIGLSVALFGFFALALLPVGLELGVECTYPVAEATSAGLLWLVGQATMLITVLVAVSLGTSLTENQSKESSCKSGNLDMTRSAYFMAVLTVAITIVFIVFFKPTYRRLEAERNNVLNTAPPIVVNSE